MLVIPTGISAGNCLGLFFLFSFWKCPISLWPLPFHQGSPQRYSLYLSPPVSFLNFSSLSVGPSPAPSLVSCFARPFSFSSGRLVNIFWLWVYFMTKMNKPAHNTVQSRETRKWRNTGALPLPALVRHDRAGKDGNIRGSSSTASLGTEHRLCQALGQVLGAWERQTLGSPR